MSPLDIIDKYYKDNLPLRKILLTHSEKVAQKALEIARLNPALNLDVDFLYEASMLHDIGIVQCDAPGICCYGTHPYICHGYLGSEMLELEGLHRHALVCERHTGAGLALSVIIERQMPLPHRDMLPVTLEEQVICFADKFFSKTRLEHEKTLTEARNSLLKFGPEGLERFDSWARLFLPNS